jgi:hypothetical protein
MGAVSVFEIGSSSKHQSQLHTLLHQNSDCADNLSDMLALRQALQGRSKVAEGKTSIIQRRLRSM